MSRNGHLRTLYGIKLPEWFTLVEGLIPYLYLAAALVAVQKTIGLVLAGLQVAITQPIRIDDVLIVEGEWGKVEEIAPTSLLSPQVPQNLNDIELDVGH